MRFLSILAVSISLVSLAAISALADIVSLDMVSPETNGYSLHGLAEISPDVVVAVGLVSTVMRSEDGGLTWAQPLQPQHKYQPEYSCGCWRFDFGNLRCPRYSRPSVVTGRT